MKTWHWRPCIWSDWEKKMMLQICFNGNLSHRHISPMSTILSVNRFISHSTLWENFQSQSLFGVGDFDAGCLQLWSDGERERGGGGPWVFYQLWNLYCPAWESKREERDRDRERYPEMDIKVRQLYRGRPVGMQSKHTVWRQRVKETDCNDFAKAFDARVFAEMHRVFRFQIRLTDWL